MASQPVSDALNTLYNFGVFKAGCTLVNINPLYQAEEAAAPHPSLRGVTFGQRGLLLLRLGKLGIVDIQGPSQLGSLGLFCLEISRGRLTSLLGFRGNQLAFVGATPQEMVIPITVLAAGDVRLAGWAEAPDPTPDSSTRAPGNRSARIRIGPRSFG